MSRDVPFDLRATCDDCGALGAFDFMGDFACQSCLDKSASPRELPTVVSEAVIALGPINVRVLHLSDGQRVIDADDFEKLTALLFSEAAPPPISTGRT